MLIKNNIQLDEITKLQNKCMILAKKSRIMYYTKERKMLYNLVNDKINNLLINHNSITNYLSKKNIGNNLINELRDTQIKYLTILRNSDINSENIIRLRNLKQAVIAEKQFRNQKTADLRHAVEILHMVFKPNCHGNGNKEEER